MRLNGKHSDGSPEAPHRGPHHHGSCYPLPPKVSFPTSIRDPFLGRSDQGRTQSSVEEEDPSEPRFGQQKGAAVPLVSWKEIFAPFCSHSTALATGLRARERESWPTWLPRWNPWHGFAAKLAPKEYLKMSGFTPQ